MSNSKKARGAAVAETIFSSVYLTPDIMWPNLLEMLLRNLQCDNLQICKDSAKHIHIWRSIALDTFCNKETDVMLPTPLILRFISVHLG